MYVHRPGFASFLVLTKVHQIIESLGQAEFKFVFKALWHPNKNSLAQSTGNLFERFSPPPPLSPQDSLVAPSGSPNSAPHSPKPGLHRAMSSIFSTPRASKEVAVKVLKRNNALQSDKSRFENELKIFSHIGRHPNICSFYGVSYDENHIAIVREYFQFGSALHYLDRNFPNGPEDEGFWAAGYRIILDVAEGLSWLHQAHVLLGPLSVYQAYMSDKNQTKLSEFNNADILSPTSLVHPFFVVYLLDHPDFCFRALILQPDDASAEMQIRAEVTQFAVFLWEVGARKTNAELPDHVVATPAALPVDENWPEPFKALIRSCSRPDIEPKLTMREIVLRVKNIMFSFDVEQEGTASSSGINNEPYAS
jgi:serine/threonine protein kinase